MATRIAPSARNAVGRTASRQRRARARRAGARRRGRAWRRQRRRRPACGSVDVVDARRRPACCRSTRRTAATGSSARRARSTRSASATRRGERVLAVMSVDGVNVVSGDTASPSQSGYVLDACECADINGWRKSLARTAAFYFTELPDAYAARTGRPDNVGVIGVAVFRERPQPRRRGRTARTRSRATTRAPSPRQRAGRAARARTRAAEAPRATTRARKPRASQGAPRRRRCPRRRRWRSSAPATAATRSRTRRRSRFERESATPNETIAIHYDRRENLVAMGVLPPPVDRARGQSVSRLDAALRAGSAARVERSRIAPALRRCAARRGTLAPRILGGRCPRPPSPPTTAATRT